MSSRRPVPHNAEAQKLRNELEQLKQQTAQVEAAGSLAQEGGASPDASAPAAGGAAPFETLSGTEQAAGSLGVHPEAWKPIKFMNNAHFDTLIKANALDDHLARRIEVCYCLFEPRPALSIFLILRSTNLFVHPVRLFARSRRSEPRAGGPAAPAADGARVPFPSSSSQRAGAASRSAGESE